VLNKIRHIYTERADERFIGELFLVTLLFAFPLAIPIIRLMQRLELKIHPNHITLTSFLFSLVAAYFFFNSQLVLGACMFYAYFLLDTVDGKWARLTGKTSGLGERLDYYFGSLGKLAMYFGLWYSQYYLNGNWIIGAVVICAHYTIAISLWIFVKEPHYKTIFKRVVSYYETEEEAFGVFFFATIFNVVTILFPILVGLQLVSVLMLYSRQKERPDAIKRLKEAVLRL